MNNVKIDNDFAIACDNYHKTCDIRRKYQGHENNPYMNEAHNEACNDALAVLISAHLNRL